MQRTGQQRRFAPPLMPSVRTTGVPHALSGALKSFFQVIFLNCFFDDF
jgi:hypothetical protein